MTGDGQDIIARLKAVLPIRWFTDATPILDGVLTGLSDAWSQLYNLLGIVQAQARISTATDSWLDQVSTDYFGIALQRRLLESDSSFRQRIQHELVRERGTRTAVSATLKDLTGRTPVIFEPARSSDTGGYTLGGTGYGTAGGYGSLALPYQFFVTAYRPSSNGVPKVAGYGMPAGGFGVGAVQYASLAAAQGQVTDADIMHAVAGVLPAAVTAWTCIAS